MPGDSLTGPTTARATTSQKRVSGRAHSQQSKPVMPLAGGLLTGKTESLDGSRTRQVEEEYGIRIGPDNPQFRDFSTLCRELGEPEHVVATAWVLQHPAVASAIVGVRTVDQLAGLDRAAEFELDDAALQRLNEIFDINDGRRIGQGRSPEAHSW